MNTSEDLHKLSLHAFARYAVGWPSTSPDYISLSQYSISALVKHADKIQGVGLALYLRAAALKREHAGASRFIFWYFADALQPDIEWGQRAIGLYGRTEPPGGAFQNWLAVKKTGASLEVPTWDLPLLADYADEFLHVALDLGSVSEEFDSWFQKQGDRGVPLAALLDHFVYFDHARVLIPLAEEF